FSRSLIAYRDLHSFPTRRSSDLVMSIFLLDYGLWSFGTLWLGVLCDTHGPRFAVLVGALSCLVVTVGVAVAARARRAHAYSLRRSEEHTSELQSLRHLVCRLLLE